MARLVCALLLCGVALVAARELAQAQTTIADLPKNLQALNARLASVASQKKASVASILASVEDYEYDSYGKKHYEDKYDKYEDKHYNKYEDKHYGKYEKDEYKHEDKYGKYEKEYKHEDKYGKYEKEDSYYKEDSYDYGYAPKKVTTKVYEKFRSHIRPQPGNANTLQFTSELTCQNPKGENGPEHEDGIIGFPIVSERMKLVTVGVCEWSVTLVKPQAISEHAELKGNTNVVCTFNEEAERHCKNGDILEKGLTISGQGLVYNFEHEPEEEKPAYEKPAYEKPAYDGKAKTEAVEAEQVLEGIDVYLTLINGVVNAGKHMKYDNGALQYFYGPPDYTVGAGRDVALRAADLKKGDPTGDYTLVFKD